MRRYKIVARIFLSLFVINFNFALAAPVLVREIHGVCADVVDVAKDATVIPQKRSVSSDRTANTPPSPGSSGSDYRSELELEPHIPRSPIDLNLFPHWQPDVVPPSSAHGDLIRPIGSPGPSESTGNSPLMPLDPGPSSAHGNFLYSNAFPGQIKSTSPSPLIPLDPGPSSAHGNFLDSNANARPNPGLIDHSNQAGPSSAHGNMGIDLNEPPPQSPASSHDSHSTSSDATYYSSSDGTYYSTSSESAPDSHSDGSYYSTSSAPDSHTASDVRVPPEYWYGDLHPGIMPSPEPHPPLHGNLGPDLNVPLPSSPGPTDHPHTPDYPQSPQPPPPSDPGPSTRPPPSSSAPLLSESEDFISKLFKGRIKRRVYGPRSVNAVQRKL